MGHRSSSTIVGLGWRDIHVLTRAMVDMSALGTEKRMIMIRATSLKAHRTAISFRSKKGAAVAERENQGRHEHQATSGYRCQGPSHLLLHIRGLGQRSHWRGGVAEHFTTGGLAACQPRLGHRLLPRFPAGQSYKAVSLAASLDKRPSDDKRRYQRRSRIEIMFGRLKDWRRVATRYDKCPKVFLSAAALAVALRFWP